MVKCRFLKKIFQHSFIIFLVFALILSASANVSINTMTYEEFSASNGVTLPYRLWVPSDYSPEKEYPVLIQLHGAGERGDNNQSQLTQGTDLMKKIINSSEYQCIIIAPQCAQDCQWVDTPWTSGNYDSDKIPMSRYLTAVKELLDSIENDYSIDSDRRYISGLSMGGFGTWDMIIRYPRTFAAAIPICGGGDPEYAYRIKNVAIRTYHSDDDPAVPVSGTRAMVEALKAVDGNIEYTEYTGLGHGVWGAAYGVSDQLEWLFSQSRSQEQLFYGDINQDNKITASDALLALQNSVKRIDLKYEDLEVADTNGDKSVTASDALLILQYSVKRITVFPAEEK